MTKEKENAKPTRREFLKTGGAAGAGLAATGLLTVAPAFAKGGADKSVPRWAMVIDLKKCIGCRACVVACKAENHTPPGVAYNIVMENEPEAEGMPFLSRPCMQCVNSSCVKVCPTGATHHRSDGIVAIDYDKCIGCRYCLAACPYNARSFDWGEYYRDGKNDFHFPGGDKVVQYEQVPSPEYGENRVRKGHKSPVGNARKCTFCLHRIYGPDGKPSGMKTACASTCPGRAIHFGNLNDPKDILHKLLTANRGHLKLKAELGNEPMVIYLL